MSLQSIAALVALATLPPLTASDAAAPNALPNAASIQNARIPVLVLTGENSTDWRWTSTRMRQVLADSGRFDVTVTLYPGGDLADDWYLDKFQVVVVDYDGPRLGEQAEENLLAAVVAGKGLVAVGRGALAFPDWKEYGVAVGLRGPATDGSPLEPLDIKVVRDHPLTVGLAGWEVHRDVAPRGVTLAEDAEVDVLGTVGDVPILVTGTSGEGRIVATTAGQVPGNFESARASHDEDFDQFLVHACEWVATGKVTPLGRIDPNTLTDADRAAGWSLLFDGASTDGWTAMDGKELSQRLVVDGDCLKINPDAAGFDFVYGERYDAFELEAEWRVAPDAVLPPDAGGSHLYDGTTAETILRPPGEFNHTRIVAADGVVTHFFNGVRILTLHLSAAEWTRHFLADPKDDPVLAQLPLTRLTLLHPGIAVWIRNVKIRRPPAELGQGGAPQGPQEVALFDGTSLAGWRWEPYAQGSNAPAPFGVEDGVLVDEGWPLGSLFSERSFGDFVLELDYLTPTTTKNPATGGIILRATPDDKRYRTSASAVVWPRGLGISLDNGRAGDLWAHQRFPINTERFRTKGVVTEHLRDVERRRGEWNHLEVRLQGDEVTVRLNGEVVNSATGLDRTPGPIVIQAGGAEFQYRGVRVTPLD